MKRDAETSMLIQHYTLYSENAPPTDIADRINAFSTNKLVKLLHQRSTKTIAEVDRCVFMLFGVIAGPSDGLRKRGFKLTLGDDDSGFLLMAYERWRLLFR